MEKRLTHRKQAPTAEQEAKSKQWLKENREAIEACNKWMQKTGFRYPSTANSRIFSC